MTDSLSNYYNRETTSDEDFLYTHLRECAQRETPEKLIARFRLLFIEGSNYPNTQIRLSLERIILSDFAAREFKFILNRSCYIFINSWLKQPRFKTAIPRLIAIFNTLPNQAATSRTTQRLRSLIRNFQQTEQYRSLRHLAEVFAQSSQHNHTEATPLRSFIGRYPCLYEHCLLTNDSNDEQRQKIRLIKEQAQRKFEVDLSKYVTYQKLQRSQNHLTNPTLLSDGELNYAIQHFTGKVDNSNTYRDLATRFRTSSRWTPCYRTFKEELYDHLTASIDPRYGNGHFNRRLYEHLQTTLVENDSQQLSENLLHKTCRKLLDFLVVESSENPAHYVFSDIITNLGATPTVGLLLKVVLLCDKVKPYLEKQFAILFNHYESFTKNKVVWLVKSLENLNIAFSTHFGSIKV
ncbi:MAG: hypothetical protein WA865_10900 [Spirulinaceae cyanobacterium]